MCHHPREVRAYGRRYDTVFYVLEGETLRVALDVTTGMPTDNIASSIPGIAFVPAVDAGIFRFREGECHACPDALEKPRRARAHRAEEGPRMPMNVSKKTDLAPLHRQTKLKQLAWPARTTPAVDLACFPELEDLSFRHLPSTHGWESLTRLKWLRLSVSGDKNLEFLGRSHRQDPRSTPRRAGDE